MKSVYQAIENMISWLCTFRKVGFPFTKKKINQVILIIVVNFVDEELVSS